MMARLLALAGLLVAVPADGEPAAGAPVVVELFTSQGCSSCPPAEEVLSNLAAAGETADRAVVPLAFHVDYWNDLGWVDPSSSPEWSERQRRYAQARRDRAVYTPQLVVAGGAHVIGSRRGSVEAAIARAPRQAPVEARARRDGNVLRVEAAAPAGAEVWLAVWEDGLTTAIERGENAGRRQREDRVVRRLVRVAAAGARGAASVTLDPRWRKLGAVAFAQRPDTLAIVGATVLRE
jgi:hypothetical protein